MRVGLLGLGTVGSAVSHRLIEDRRLVSERAGVAVELAAVAVRDPGRRRELDLGGIPLTGDAVALAADPEIDIVVELMGGLDPAARAIETALGAGRAVVTANKTVIGRDGPRLAALARSAGCPLRFEAAVGAGTPMIALLRDGLLGDRVQRLDGVLNGTTNFILGRMAAGGMSFATALAEAQSLGYAEADPSADVDGGDAASKLAILAWLGFGSQVDPGGFATEGVRGIDMIDVRIAGELGYAVKLLARAQVANGALAASVRPTLIPQAHPLSGMEGAGNGLVVESDLAGRIFLTGAGAGAASTASAVVGDIIAAARSLAAGSTETPPGRAGGPPAAAAGDVESDAYLRVEAGDDPDATDTIALMLEDRGLRVETALERAARGHAGRDVIVLTRPAPRGMLERALETLDTVPLVIRIAAVLDRLPEAG